MIKYVVNGKIYIATEDYYATKNLNSPILIRGGDAFKVASFVDNEWVKVEPRQNYCVCGIPQREIKIDWDLFIDNNDQEENYSPDYYRKNWKREKEYAQA